MADSNLTPTPTPTPKSSLALARSVLDAEAAAVRQVPLGEPFLACVGLIGSTTGETGDRGTLIVSGLGKTGPIAQKLAATFASTGTPSHYVHPTEAMHGDLGRIRAHDVVLLLSYSGQTEEVVTLAAILRQDGVPVIAMTGQTDSELARLATHTLSLGSLREACPHNLAPTASTTAMLALGDALALAVSQQRGFEAADFHRMHPGGNLGRMLLPITEAMRFEVGTNLPVCKGDVTLKQAYEQAQATETRSGIRRAGALLVVDDQGKLTGIFTDGDLRRLITKGLPQPLEEPIGSVMTAGPRVLWADQLVRDAVAMVREHRIDEVPVVDASGRAVGLIDVQDLVALRVIRG